MAQRFARSRRRFPAFLLAAAVVAPLIIQSTGGALAATSCRARNASLGTAARSDLQAVINASRAGNRILISGVCAGNYTVTKSLTLEGQPTTAVPTPTLDGNQAGSVVTVTAGTVRFKKLTIQNGLAPYGGGISMAGSGNVILNATTVAWNDASDPEGVPAGGGIAVGGGTLTLNTGTRVQNNTLIESGEGAGIYSDGGPVILNGNARVALNSNAYEGGGINSDGGTVYLRATASVQANEAGIGGGIYVHGGRVFLDASAVVKGNEAWQGGGMYVHGDVYLSGSASVINNVASDRFGGVYAYWIGACDSRSPSPWIGALSPNIPDDPFTVEYLTCS